MMLSKVTLLLITVAAGFVFAKAVAQPVPAPRPYSPLQGPLVPSDASLIEKFKKYRVTMEQLMREISADKLPSVTLKEGRAWSNYRRDDGGWVTEQVRDKERSRLYRKLLRKAGLLAATWHERTGTWTFIFTKPEQTDQYASYSKGLIYTESPPENLFQTLDSIVVENPNRTNFTNHREIAAHWYIYLHYADHQDVVFQRATRRSAAVKFEPGNGVSLAARN